MLISPVFISQSAPFPPLIYTPPDRRTSERQQRMRMKRGSGKTKKMKRTRNTLRWGGLSLSSAMRELWFHCIPGVHCTSSHGSSLVEKLLRKFWIQVVITLQRSIVVEYEWEKYPTSGIVIHTKPHYRHFWQRVKSANRPDMSCYIQLNRRLSII